MWVQYGVVTHLLSVKNVLKLFREISRHFLRVDLNYCQKWISQVRNMKQNVFSFLFASSLSKYRGKVKVRRREQSFVFSFFLSFLFLCKHCIVVLISNDSKFSSQVKKNQWMSNCSFHCTSIFSRFWTIFQRYCV